MFNGDSHCYIFCLAVEMNSIHSIQKVPFLAILFVDWPKTTIFGI